MELRNMVIRILEIFKTNRFLNGLVCAHCKNENVILYGTYKGKQRYKCKTCGRTFTDFSNSPLNMSHFHRMYNKGSFLTEISRAA